MTASPTFLSFKFPKTDIPASTDYSVYVPIPDGLKYTGSGKVEIFASNGASRLKFAELDLDDTGGGFYLRFVGDIWNQDSTAVDITDAEIFVYCVLDMEEIGGAEGCKIRLLGESSIIIKIGDNQAKEHNLVKTGEFKDGMFNWTITFTPGSDLENALPIYFTDTFDSSVQSFVEASGLMVDDEQKSKGTDIDIDDDVYTLSSSADGITTVQYKIVGTLEAGTPMVFKYSTALTAAEMDATNYNKDTVANNYVNLMTSSASLIVETRASVAASPKDKAWITKKVSGKNGTTNITVDSKTIDWEVTITAWDYGLESLVLHDTIQNGLTLVSDSVVIKYGSNTVSGASLKVDGDGSDALVETGPDGDGNTGFTLVIPKDSSGAYASTYTVTYSTIVDDKYFGNDSGASISSPKFNNKAWLTFSWLSGSGPTPPEPTVNLTGVGVNTHIIRKSGKYNPSTHKITWTVTVNPYKFDVKSGIIVDDLSNITNNLTLGLHLTYVPGSFKPSTGSEAYFYAGVVAGNKLSVTLNNLGTHTAQFTFETWLSDEDAEEFVDNHRAIYYNTVNFAGTVVINSYEESVTDSATTGVDVISKVLSKESVSYDYTDNTVEWVITVNHNKMPMEDATLIDTIPPYQTFVEGSVLIDGQEPSSPASVKWDSVNSELTIELGTINAQTIVTFKTKVQVNDNPDFTDSSVIVVGNSVKLKRTDYPEIIPEVTAEQEIKNPILGKSGAYDSQNRKIFYSVNINPNGMDLSDIKLTDTLPAGLRLDIDSVALWDASFDAANSKFTKENSSPAPVSDYKWSYDASNNSFSINLLKAQCYILEYECYILSEFAQGTEYINKIAFEGSYFNESFNYSEKGVVAYGGWGLYHSGTANLTIVKRDAKTPYEKLEGITFQLWTKTNGVNSLVDEGETDQNGELTFYLLTPGREYWLVETAGIDGFNKGTGTVVDGMTTTSLSKYVVKNLTANEKKEITVYNDRDAADVSFLKVNDLGQRVSGAVFKLTDNANGESWTRTSGSDGKVTFKGVSFGDYALVETKAASNHELNEDVFAVIVDKDGTYEIKDSDGITLPNSAAGMGRIVNVRIVNPPDYSTPTPDPTRSPRTIDRPDPMVTATPTPSPTDSEILAAEIETPSDEPPETETPSEEPLENGTAETRNLQLVAEPEAVKSMVMEQSPEDPENNVWIVTAEDIELYGDSMPPVPVGTRLILDDDGGYIQIDEDGTPLGKWHFDEDESVWVFDDYAPLGSIVIPQTGTTDLLPAITLLSLFGVVLILAGFILKRRAVGKKRNE